MHKRADSDQQQKNADQRELPSSYERLQDILHLTERIAKSKGWLYRLAHYDEAKWEHAQVQLWREARFPGSPLETVSAICDISLDGQVRFSIEKTSPNGYGLDDLAESFQRESLQATWIRRWSSEEADKISRPIPLERLLKNFHSIARQLTRRHDNRATLSISDEYDVQDLLHALLKGYSDDIRAEEVVPSYAGGSARMDFLLKSEKLAIEAKMTSRRLRDREISDQLIIDIARYKSHPWCKILVCFIYDPGGYIQNPAGIESDLGRKQDGLEVRTVINPR
jgi:hypothetical protein